jgi:hypothetical protein
MVRTEHSCPMQKWQRVPTHVQQPLIYTHDSYMCHFASWSFVSGT